MSVYKGEDIIFTFSARILDSAVKGPTIQWLRLQVSDHKTLHLLPVAVNYFNIEFFPWTPTEQRALISFSARIYRPIYKDGALVAITVENNHGVRRTIRFSDFADLTFTTMQDEAQRRTA